MREDTIVRSYAETLFELAERHEGAESFGGGIEMVARFMEDPKVREFFATPRVPVDSKKSALERAVGPSVPVMLLRFLKVVVDRGRQRLLPDIARQYRAILEKHLGRRHMDVTVARPLDARGLEDLRIQLSSATGANVIPHVRVRPDIIGGIVIREGDTVYDGSLKRQLDALRRRLTTAELQTQER